jgi:hypothetical protein
MKWGTVLSAPFYFSRFYAPIFQDLYRRIRMKRETMEHDASLIHKPLRQESPPHSAPRAKPEGLARAFLKPICFPVPRANQKVLPVPPAALEIVLSWRTKEVYDLSRLNDLNAMINVARNGI